jgi:hypothetical protein
MRIIVIVKSILIVMLLSRYMTLKKDDKSASKIKDKPKKQIIKSNKQTLKREETVTSITKEKEKIKAKETTSCEKSQSQDDDEDNGSGPSSGIRLTYEERQNNLCEVYRLQRKMLRELLFDENEDEEMEEEEDVYEQGDEREADDSNQNEL